ncbi:GM23219, partial [Drosophila sechellia]
TNLVRPFTVLQLKGLLARTGKIVEEDGFWIDRIKSKCYVAYSTEDLRDLYANGMLAKRNQATSTNTATTGVGRARIDWTRGLGMRNEPDRSESVPGTERDEDAIGSDLIAMHMQEAAVDRQVKPVGYIFLS